MRDPDRGTRRRRSWRFNFPPRPTRWRSGVSYPRATGARLTIAKHAYVRSHAHRVEVTSPLATAPSRGARPYLERLSPRTIAQGQAAPAGVWSLRVPSSGLLRTIARRPWRVTVATRSEVFARCTLTRPGWCATLLRSSLPVVRGCGVAACVSASELSLGGAHARPEASSEIPTLRLWKGEGGLRTRLTRGARKGPLGSHYCDRPPTLKSVPIRHLQLVSSGGWNRTSTGRATVAQLQVLTPSAGRREGLPSPGQDAS